MKKKKEKRNYQPEINPRKMKEKQKIPTRNKKSYIIQI